jgi:hypothetical protein
MDVVIFTSTCMDLGLFSPIHTHQIALTDGFWMATRHANELQLLFDRHVAEHCEFEGQML